MNLLGTRDTVVVSNLVGLSLFDIGIIIDLQLQFGIKLLGNISVETVISKILVQELKLNRFIYKLHRLC